MSEYVASETDVRRCSNTNGAVSLVNLQPNITAAEWHQYAEQNSGRPNYAATYRACAELAQGREDAQCL